MTKQNKLTLTITSLLAVAFILVAFLPKNQVGAATHTVTPGPGAIQTAIDAAVDGDIIEISAGTYDESLLVNKSLTIRGIGSVVIKSVDGHTSAKGIDIQNTQNVALENLTFDGSNVVSPPNTTGVDINSVDGVTLTNITVRDYAKNGIAVTTQFDPTYVAGKNPVFNNVTVENVGWAGIAFYTKSSNGHEAPLSGIQFIGTTTISGTQYGIQFGDTNTTAAITGPAGAPVDLGVVVFTNNQTAVSNDNKQVAINISSSSTIDGQPISPAAFAGLNLTIDGVSVNPAAQINPLVPGVPNTGKL